MRWTLLPMVSGDHYFGQWSVGCLCTREGVCQCVLRDGGVGGVVCVCMYILGWGSMFLSIETDERETETERGRQRETEEREREGGGEEGRK